MPDTSTQRGHRSTHPAVGRSSPRRATAILSLAGASALSAAANAAGALVATATLGLRERGVMVLAVTVTGLVVLVAGLGTGTALRGKLPHLADTSGRRRLLASYFWLCCVTMALAAGLAVVAVRASAPLIDPALSEPTVLLAVGLSAAVQLLLQQFNEAWFAQGLFRRGGAWSAAATTGGLAALVATAALFPHVWAILLAQAVGQLVVVMAEAGALRRRGGIVVGRPVWPDIAVLIRLGLPTLGLGVGLAFAMRADRYILGAVAGPAAVAVYSLAATLSETPRMLSSSFGQLTMRDVAVDPGNARIGRSVVAAVLACAAVCVPVAAAGWLFIVWAFGAEFAEARTLLVWLLLAEICFAPYAVASRGILGGGWTGTAGALGAIGSVCALAGYAIVIPAAGMTGAAIVSGGLYLCLSISSGLWLRHRLRGLATVATPALAPPVSSARSQRAP